MSKDKGVKNQKKSPADKSLGKKKPISAYKAESKSSDSTLNAFIPKPDNKPEGKKK